MCVVVERSPVIPETLDNEFDLSSTTYLPDLNTSFSRGVVQKETMKGFSRPQNDISYIDIELDIVSQMSCNNYDWSVRNCEMGGPSYVIVHMKFFDLNIDQVAQPGEADFGGGNIIQQVPYPSQSTDRAKVMDLKTSIIILLLLHIGIPLKKMLKTLRA
ncbi:hypothetical protein HAX54_053317 [Datura stramonium]|uniref:Uncharacterized protein n=1 Tax=Datura stramonium TaxID=4076 RepID=A0ABS8T261_DATST|nr:hypothetical protein [Datura stramonium]